MKRTILLGALTALAAGSAAPLAAAPAKKATAARDWSRTVAATPEGGFRIGNPNAKVKLVEFGSMTCPHCADFAGAAHAPLLGYVRSGKVSFEFRNFVLNGIDATASLVARCAGPAGFFQVTNKLFATQKQWVGKIAALSQAQKDEINALPQAQRLGRVAEIGGLTQIAAQHGVPAARAKQCLADEAGAQRLAQMSEAASALGVHGTPSFLINGAMVHAHGWGELEPQIRQAGG